MPSDQTRWIVGPPGPGEVNIQIAVDSAAKLSPELRQALEKLVQSLQHDEVEAYRACTTKTTVCKADGACQPKIISPCVSFETCRIG
jgi:hypothetical protein